MKKIFAVKNHSLTVDLTLLFLRVVSGYAFMLHGWGKIQNPFHWMGADAATHPVLQALAALSEFGGGLALILGLLTRLGALGIACTMVVAVHLHAMVLHDPFVNQKGGGSYELALVYLAISLLLLAAGPGRFSLDRKLFGPKS